MYCGVRRYNRNLFLDFYPGDCPVHFADVSIFLTVGVLGGKKGSLAVLVYILLGAVGVPVFAGFSAGIGILFGNTGGYIVGFLASSLVMWGMEKFMGRKTWTLAIQMVVGLIVCYAIGTVWFMIVYAQSSGAVGLTTVLGWCVIPFIVPDLVKIVLALVLSKRLSAIMRMV